MERIRHSWHTEREEALYLLGSPPSWMTRYGIIVIALFFSILFTLSCLIEYPDIVTCRVVLTTENPPIRVIAPSTNRLSALFVHENQSVTEGPPFGVLAWQEVSQFQKWVKYLLICLWKHKFKKIPITKSTKPSFYKKQSFTALNYSLTFARYCYG